MINMNLKEAKVKAMCISVRKNLFYVQYEDNYT